MFLKNLKIELACNPAIPPQSIYLEKILIHKDIQTAMVYNAMYNHNSTFYNSQDMEATEMSINRGMDKEDIVHIYNGTLLTYKRERNNVICSNIDGSRDY